MKVFGQRMRGCRERLGLTQGDLAAKAGLHPSAISFFESGVRRPSLDNLIAVADALGESIDVLVGRTDGVSPTGRDVEALLARFGAMREDDRDSLLKMAAIFAERSQSPFVAIDP